MANEIVSYPVTLVFKTSSRVILILLFTVRKSLPKNLVISNNYPAVCLERNSGKLVCLGPLLQGLLAGCSQSCTWDHCRLCLSSSEAGSTFRFTPWLTGYKIPFLTGCWTQGLSSLLAVGWRPLSVLVTQAPPARQLTSSSWTNQDSDRFRVTVSQTEAQKLCPLSLAIFS